MTTPIKLERPSQYNKADGFLNGMKWDNGNKSGLFFFTQSRTTGSGDKAKKIYYDFTVRFFGHTASVLAFLLNYQKEQEAAGQKYPLLINMSLQMTGWKRPTGKMVGEKQNIPETESVFHFNGKDAMMMNTRTYEVLLDAETFVLQQEAAQA